MQRNKESPEERRHVGCGRHKTLRFTQNLQLRGVVGRGAVLCRVRFLRVRRVDDGVADSGDKISGGCEQVSDGEVDQHTAGKVLYAGNLVVCDEDEDGA